MTRDIQVIAQIDEDGRIEIHVFSPLDTFTLLQRRVLTMFEEFCSNADIQPCQISEKWVAYVTTMEKLEQLGRRVQDLGFEFKIE